MRRTIVFLTAVIQLLLATVGFGLFVPLHLETTGSFKATSRSKPSITPSVSVGSSSRREGYDDTNSHCDSTTFCSTQSSFSWKKQWGYSRWRHLLGRRRKPLNLTLNFEYEVDQLIVEREWTSATTTAAMGRTIGVLLIHPIGVGIGKWYYQRLFQCLASQENNSTAPLLQNSNHRVKRLICIAPDLLGSGSASNPTKDNKGHRMYTQKLPLLNITDWSDQLLELMHQSQEKFGTIDHWCIVANGGCAPIALQVAAASSATAEEKALDVSQVIISSSPRLPFFLQSSDPRKVERSYRTLSGVVGTLFWWYALRSDGAFLQRFSERNLVADPANLGAEWKRQCVETATMHGGNSRYSTFAFLAGALQDGCRTSLNTLFMTRAGSSTLINFISGKDKRRNRAKSWFWKKANDTTTATATTKPKSSDTFQDYVRNNSAAGRKEIMIQGRISLAHEDPIGFAEALVDLLHSPSRDLPP